MSLSTSLRVAYVFSLLLSSGLALGDSYFEFSGVTYEIVTRPLTFEDARISAEAKSFMGISGRLVEIETRSENDAIFSALQEAIASSDFDKTTSENGGGSAYVWIGATDLGREGDWKWASTDTLFWSGQYNGEAVGSAFNNWGSDSGFQNEPDDFLGQDAAAIALQTWPNPNLDFGFILGSAGQWNDVDTSDRLFSIVEYSQPMNVAPSRSQEAFLSILNAVLTARGMASTSVETSGRDIKPTRFRRVK